MLISEFARVTGLSRDTIRFYVKLGLLQPSVDGSSGNRYQRFDDQQVERAIGIRQAQSLGFTLKEIGAMDALYYGEGMTTEKQIGLLQKQLDQVSEQMQHLADIRDYLSTKIAKLSSEHDDGNTSFERSRGSQRS